MITQEKQVTERKITAILKILSESNQPIGSRQISRQLHQRGILLGERAVRYHLKIMDERGFTRCTGTRDGRTITVRGLEELRDSLVSDKIGFVSNRIEQLAFLSNFGLRAPTGKIPVDLALFRREDISRGTQIMYQVFQSGLCSSELVALLGEGSGIGDTAIPAGMLGLATVSSVALNGCLLKAGIPIHARFGGLIQVREGKPLRFVELVEFSGSTIDPLHILTAGRLTDVLKAATNGDGRILAIYNELPTLSAARAEELLERLQKLRLMNQAMLARPNEGICEIPSSPDKIGLITFSGINPPAAAMEAGIEVTIHAMCGMLDIAKMYPFKQLL